MKEELEKEKMDGSGSFVVPFLMGGLVGAGIALMLAPKSGKELRKDIKDLTSDTREAIASTIDKGKELYEGSRAAVKDAIDAGKSAYVEERDRRRQAA
ncbi:MAG TPA: YtxH domain-containing protein [Nitrospirota bacterium]